ncbi:hypothetical protein ACJJTC_006641, partial [Scirpophaga incertulas]
MKEASSDLSEPRLQNILKCFTRCKLEIEKENKELIDLRNTNSRLEDEVKQARELEKSHRYHLQRSREMIENLQETVSHLVYLKRDMNKLKDELSVKDAKIFNIEKDKQEILQENNENITKIRNTFEKQLNEMQINCEEKVQQMQNEFDTQIAQFTCAIEELRNKMKEMETQHRDKMNIVVLEYEEKIQRGAAQITQLQDELTRQATRADSNIDTYRRRLEELEEKLKQNQFKQYLAQNTYSSQYEDCQVERPYSVNRDTYPVLCSGDAETSRGKYTPTICQNKTDKTNTLKVMYFGNEPQVMPKATEKKGSFNITKRRKLYNEK